MLMTFWSFLAMRYTRVAFFLNSLPSVLRLLANSNCWPSCSTRLANLKSQRTSAFVTKQSTSLSLRWIDPECIILQSLTRSTWWPGTKCSHNRKILCVTLVRDLNVVQDSATKGAGHAEEVCLLNMQYPNVIVEKGQHGCCLFLVCWFCYISNIWCCIHTLPLSLHCSCFCHDLS